MEVDTSPSKKKNSTMETDEETVKVQDSPQKKSRGEVLEMEEAWDNTKPTYTAL